MYNCQASCFLKEIVPLIQFTILLKNILQFYFDIFSHILLSETFKAFSWLLKLILRINTAFGIR